MMPKAPSVCIVMATYNPDPHFFFEQIESIRAQTYTNWTCLINDDCSTEDAYQRILQQVGSDSRFTVHRNAERAGVYHNFERALARVPPNADVVSLADQDDIWLAHKLERLVRALEDPSVEMVHSDLSIIDEKGEIQHTSCWSYEKRNVRNADSAQLLLLRNVVTGCAAMFRRSLLDWVLPFPPQGTVPFFYHDLWIALLASSLGRITSIAEPLVLYRAHAGNTLGPVEKGLPSVLRKLLENYPRYLSRDYLDVVLDRSRREWEGRKALSLALAERLRQAKAKPPLNLFSEFPDFGLSSLALTWLSLTHQHHALSVGLRVYLGKLQRDAQLVGKSSFKWASRSSRRAGR